MTIREIAKRLGVSRTWVMLVERRALAKMAVEMDREPMPAAQWASKMKVGTSNKRCGICGEPGHYRATCIRRVRP